MSGLFSCEMTDPGRVTNFPRVSRVRSRSERHNEREIADRLTVAVAFVSK